MGDTYMKIRYLFISLFVFFCSIYGVEAEVCDAEDFAKAKAYASNLAPTYTYAGYSGNWQAYLLEFDFGEYAGKFSFAESNMSGVTPSNDSIYVNSGHRSIDIFYNTCAYYKIATVNVDVPYFNVYSTRSECDGLEDSLDICNPHYEGKITKSDFEESVSKYEEEHRENQFNLFEFVKKYYFYFIGVCVFLIVLIIYLVIQHNKHYKLD